MATKAKESSVVGKEKKAPSSNSHITSTKRSTTKPSQTTKATTSNTPSSDKNIPNYLKPTISSRLESPSSFNSDAIATNLNRRRSLDRPQSSSNFAKQKQPSPSRLHKALVSPGPRERILVSHRSSSVPNKSTKPSKPISDRASKNPNEGKTKLLYVKKSTKKVDSDHASANSTNAAKITAGTGTGTTKGSKVEVKQVTNQEVEVIKIENDKNQVEHASEISQHVDTEHELEESDQPHTQANDHEKVISIVSEEELKNKQQGEKTEDEEHEEEENTNHDDNNNNGNHPEEQSEAEDKQENVVNEKEDEGGVVNVIELDHTSENKNEEEAVVEEIEVVEGGTSTEEVEEAKVEATPPKQQGKKESQVSNDVIEETASKLLEERKNKVRALAGAFQTVIDHQTTSK